eukprot:GFKZ01010218.1.p1 GENE.GFKZ01010218.1~~GFKZ01010218.1.p1  ORF type:complete len:212 (+),score=47.61 GFKZ01010218.1:316-951(+)
MTFLCIPRLAVSRSPLPLSTVSRRLFCSSSTRSFTASAKDPLDESMTENIFDDQANALEGKATREEIHRAFSLRSQDAIRYDYFAQRAELEAELEAASTFRGLREMAKQQAMGYLELLEEYGDATFGSTVENVEESAGREREYAEELFVKSLEVSNGEDFPQIEEWFEDMVAASGRAVGRLELVASMMESEGMEEEIMDGEDVDVPEKVKN